MNQSGAAPPASAAPSRRQKTRVLQVIGSLNFGGAEEVLVKLAVGLDRQQYEVRVCGTLGLGPLAERLEQRGVEVARAGPAGRIHNYLRPWHVQRVIAEFQPDIVHSHGLPPLAELGQIAAVRLVPRWVHTFHFGNYPHTEKRRHMYVERVCATAPDQLVAVSQKQRQDLMRYHRISDSRIRTVTNGVDANPFIDDGVTRAAKRAELGIADDAYVIGSVAVLTEQKGIAFLLEAARHVVSERPATKVVIIGGGPLEAALRAQAARLGLESNVIFTSWRSDTLQLLRALDVYVMASLWEAMPVALLEAMAARLPIVVTNVGQNAQIVEDQRSALVVPPGDAAAIASALEALYRAPERAAALATEAWRRASQAYSTQRMIAEYEQVYERTRRTTFRQARMIGRLARW